MLRAMTQSTYSIAQYFIEQEITSTILKEKLANIDINQQEVDAINTVKDAAKEKLAAYLALSVEQQKAQRKPNVHRAVHLALNKLIDNRTNTGWTSLGHTAIDVPVFAFGAKKQQFSGAIDNTDIAKAIFTLLENK